jgi:catechol 2,3-dioxygenase-like lactoylglutathione lyase family enzyme
MIQGIFHININVTDFERSLEFYQMLGFRVVADLGEGGSQALNAGLRIPDGRGRAALLMLGEDPHATRIDLIEWKNPKTAGQAYPHLYHVGMARLALKTKNLPQVYEDLKARGVEFFSEPQELNLPNQGRASFVCFTDPDGTILELIDF